MEAKTFRAEDMAGLLIAILLHAGLALALLFQPEREREIMEPQNRITVNLASEVGLVATSPDPAELSRASSAPILAPDPSPGLATPDLPVPDADPTPPERSLAPTPPQQSRDNRSRRRPDQERRRNPPKKDSPKEPPKSGGGSRIGDDFLPEGAGNSDNAKDTRTPASQIGPRAQRSLRRALDSQIKPHWRGKVPQGPDAERLISVLSFRLNEDGSLKGRPTCRTKRSSVTDLNRRQVNRHCELAVRAVQLAAPFDLPDRLYNGWKFVPNWEMKK